MACPRGKVLQYRFAFILLLLTVSAAWGADNITLTVGGERVYLHRSPVLDGKTVYAPLPALNALGARYETDKSRKKDGQEISITNAAGRKFSSRARLMENDLMVPIQELAPELGAKVEWNADAKRLDLKARLEKIEFDSTDLRITTSYPVTYDVIWWAQAKKLIVDLKGVDIPTRLPIENQTQIPIRTGVQADSHTARVVLDMPCDVRRSVKSSPKTSLIFIVVSGLQAATGMPESVVPDGPIPEEVETVPPPVEISNIDYKEQSARRLDVFLTTSGPVKYRTAILRDPDRLIVDLPNAALTREFPDIPVSNDILQWIGAEQTGERRVKLTMNLKRLVGFDVVQSKSGDKLVISLALPKGADGKLAGKTVVIDPGHGGKDCGATGIGGCYEKDSNLVIALRLQKALSNAGVVALLTRKTDVAVDTNKKLDLQKRAAYAARHSADLFISIHSNSIAGSKRPSGIMTFYHGHDISGNALANAIHAEAVKAWKVPDLAARSDYVLYRTGLGVLRHASETYGIPAALIELGYMIHPNDMAKIRDPKYQQKAADAIVRGVKAYFEGNPNPPKRIMPPEEPEESDVQAPPKPGAETQPKPKPEVKPPPKPEAKPPASDSSGPHRPGEGS